MNQLGKLISRIPGSRLLITSLRGSALRKHVESRLARLMSTSVLEALLVKLISKDSHLVFSTTIIGSDNFLNVKCVIIFLFIG